MCDYSLRSTALIHSAKLFDLNIYVEGTERVDSVFNSKITHKGSLLCIIKETRFWVFN